ncbi:hypothetical protein HanIR_Chr01g0008001 [Helianthus annuus]|nr:hypothetical protein HanIR_Chr01g0008001 [Helianthus annuus]
MKSGTGWMYELEVKNHVFDLIGNVGHIGRRGQMVERLAIQLISPTLSVMIKARYKLGLYVDPSQVRMHTIIVNIPTWSNK